MESSNSTTEDTQFKNIAPRITNAAANNTPGGSQAVRVNNGTVNGGYTGRIAGPGITLKVAPGDVISVETYAYYEGGSGYGNLLASSSIITAVAGIFGGVSGATGDPGKIFNAFNQDYTVGGFVGGGGTGIDTEPAAYLNFIMFDQNMMADPATLPMSAVKVTSAASYAKQKLTIGPITIPSPGYVYIYVNDNSNVNNWVYFDDLKVTQLHSPFVAGGDFYPFGMAMEDRQIKIENYRYGYQGQYAEKDTLTNWNAFQLRMYEPRFGRWLSPDPKEQFSSPYIGIGNNPVGGVDPDGGKFFDIFANEAGKEAWYETADAAAKDGFKILVKADLPAVTITPSLGNFIVDDLVVRGARLVEFGKFNLRAMGRALDNIGGFANGANNMLTYGAYPLENPNRHLDPTAYRINQQAGEITAALASTIEGRLPSTGGSPVYATPNGPTITPTAPSTTLLDVHGMVFSSGSDLPSLDQTGKVHGALPSRSEFYKYSRHALNQLLSELKISVQSRIRKNSELGVDKAGGDTHGLRQAQEQELIRDLENYLNGK